MLIPDWQRTLDTFDVPYVLAWRDGRVTTSPAATRLFGDGPAERSTRLQAIRLATDAVAADLYPVSGAGAACPARDVPAAGGRLVLRLRVVGRDPSTRVAVIVVVPADSHTNAPPGELHCTGLTVREREVASLIATGCATKEVARMLSISTHTARHHTEKVFCKLGVQSRAAVVALLGGGNRSSLHDRMGQSSHVQPVMAGE